MTTASFDKTFVISNKASINKIRQDLARPRHVEIQVRDYDAENAKGVELLRQRFCSTIASKTI